MSLNTQPRVRARVRLVLGAQRCGACRATLLRGAWVWRERTAGGSRYFCATGACRTRRVVAL